MAARVCCCYRCSRLRGAYASPPGGTTSHAPGSDPLPAPTPRAEAKRTPTVRARPQRALWRHGRHKEGSGQTTATGAYGGTATHYAGQGTVATGAYGGSAYHAEGSGAGYYGGSYAAYHPPTTVNVYGAGCYNCGGWNAAGAAAAGVVVGAAVGASVASANNAAVASNAYAAGVATGSANTSAAYNAGVAAGASGAYSMGAIYPTLPAGATMANVQGKPYYISGNTWFQPSYGANGVYYRVVPTP